jgi:tRNA threonylcarbamoyladenosine biosynthesis protein TsaB
MANLLVLEAASDSCSIALQIDNHIIERIEAAPRMHSRLLYPMLNDLMDQAGIKPQQLDAVVFGKGPGSFTGLRIAAATAQGIGFACDIPLMGISTLQAMATQARAELGGDQVVSIMDARMNELYVGFYGFNNATQLMQPLINDQLSPVDASLQQMSIVANKKLTACGHGLKLTELLDASIQEIPHQDPLQVLKASAMLPMANSLYKQQNVISPEQVELVYLREQSHWKTIKQQKQLKK